MTTTPSPRTEAGQKLVKLRGLFCGETEVRANSWVAQIEREAEARADVDGLVALRDELRKAVEAFVDAWEEQRLWKEDAEFPTDEYRALLALLAGDKAEAPE